jgi:anaerobic dimethyl sulfoxide reductase subunit B (iron-sulfur subunit)
MKLGFYFDMNRCIGCYTCQIACKDKNDLEVGPVFRHVRNFEVGEYPEATVYHYSSSCNHCANPACVAACPNGAAYIDEEGAVIIDAELCDGCQNCVMACPYQVPQYMETEGIVRKCDFCREYREQGKNPVCVDACLTRCLDWGDVEELKAKYGADLMNELPFLPAGDITGSSSLVKPKECAKQEGAEEKII